MAKRKVLRRAGRILGEEPALLVWCGIPSAVPRPPKEIHRAAGKGRLKPGRHWAVYVGAVLFCVIVVPYMLMDLLSQKAARRIDGSGRRNPPSPGREETGDTGARPRDQVFDGDWNLTAGQLLLRWYDASPNRARLFLATRDRVCFAASPRRRVFPHSADDFRLMAEFGSGEVRIEAETGQPRGFARFDLHFPDGSWLTLGNLAGPDDADRFFDAVAGPGPVRR
ncbi:hypothetical protein AF335_26010 [Streptomyces eurocidicus]|uniref:Uncharacterized protein n=1 Tax=Streptomyces eurocidicus TaxID=66423 RepID=A0A2N8NPY7_STREU|nr:hypothetical protein [Streptomyces eurocidicus]MBB5122408.1 hypothetical protein [Streptomyces eurocidicus]MBF6051692.1 hypothetical protein [Streptomyces eurocidicus]PNE30833.1 hypothetical protein AF335_26010 [Streptomyces eurocidicus]